MIGTEEGPGSSWERFLALVEASSGCSQAADDGPTPSACLHRTRPPLQVTTPLPTVVVG